MPPQEPPMPRPTANPWLPVTLALATLFPAAAADVEIGRVLIHNHSGAATASPWTLTIEPSITGKINGGIEVFKLKASGAVDPTAVRGLQYYTPSSQVEPLKLAAGTSYRLYFYSNNGKDLSLTFGLRDGNGNGRAYEVNGKFSAKSISNTPTRFISTPKVVDQRTYVLQEPAGTDPVILETEAGIILEIKQAAYPTKVAN
jgi:hypothetical protein